MTDLLGPASAPNAVTSRPADARVFGADDTWFKGCSGPDVDDGTEIQAEFENSMLAQMRRAIRGMGVAENNADDDMLLKAIMAARDYWLIDSAVTKTVGGVGADFVDLAAAFQWLSKYRITQNGSVTFNLTVGQFIYSASLTVDHPNLDRVTINGANLLAGAPTSATFVITGASAAQRATDNANHLTALRAIYATEIRFTSARGLEFYGPSPTINNVLITSAGATSPAADGLTLRAGGFLSNVSVHGFPGYAIVPFGTVIAGGGRHGNRM